MRWGRAGLTTFFLLAIGCATGANLDDVGAVTGGGGGAQGGTAGQGSGGKADNPTGGVGNESSGGGPSGGGGAAGGGASGGASSGGASSGGSSSGGTGGACPTGQKHCGGVCITPNAGVGCNTVDYQCTACPSPANSVPSCVGTLCDFTCNSGYTKSGSACVYSGGGGASSGGGGGTSTGGSGGNPTCLQPCDPNNFGDQLICGALCLIGSNPGFCWPVLNCCICP